MKARITAIEQTEKVGIFSIIFENYDYDEFRKFMERFKDDASLSKDLNVILGVIKRIETYGSLERFFRYEGRMRDNVVALPAERSKLRLYCLRLSDQILIIGNGGKKNNKTYEEDPELNGYVITLQQLDRLISKKVRDGEITIAATEISDIEKTTFDL